MEKFSNFREYNHIRAKLPSISLFLLMFIHILEIKLHFLFAAKNNYKYIFAVKSNTPQITVNLKEDIYILCGRVKYYLHKFRNSSKTETSKKYSLHEVKKAIIQILWIFRLAISDNTLTSQPKLQNNFLFFVKTQMIMNFNDGRTENVYSH